MASGHTAAHRPPPAPRQNPNGGGFIPLAYKGKHATLWKIQNVLKQCEKPSELSPQWRELDLPNGRENPGK
jgi:hypothetical protein